MTSAATATAVIIVVTASAATSAASATASAHRVHDVLNFLVCSFTHFQYRTFEYQILACVRVVKVDSYSAVSDFTNVCIELVSFAVVQHDDVSFEHVVFVKLAVRTAECRFRKSLYSFRINFAVCFCTRDSKVEVVSLSKCCYFFFKSFKCISYTCDELERMATVMYLFSII